MKCFHSILACPTMPPQTPPARNELVDWYQSLPPITKSIFVLSIATTVAPALGLVSPYSLILNWPAVSKLQVPYLTVLAPESSEIPNHSYTHYSYGDL